mgnify:CR=1 FL=1
MHYLIHIFINNKLAEDSRVIISSENIANASNNYFIFMIVKLRNDIPVGNTSHWNYLMERSVNAFNFEPVTSVNINKLL